MPKRSSNFAIMASGTAEPPDSTRLRLENFKLCCSAYCSSASHTVGTPALTVTCSFSIISYKPGAIEARARQHQFRAADEAAIRSAPAIDVKHRHHRQHALSRRQAQHSRHADGHGVEDDCAMRIQRALGIARGAGGVADRGTRAFIELRPVKLLLLHRDQCLVTIHIGDRHRAPACCPHRSCRSMPRCSGNFRRSSRSTARRCNRRRTPGLPHD